MSTELAVAAVTATLVDLLGPATGSVSGPLSATVTARSPDRARTNVTGHQLNVFLYQVTPDAAWRNQEVPQTQRSGESARTRPPLALVLHYLLTAISGDDEEDNAQRLLGAAMSILHEHPVLARNAIQNALSDARLHEQVECVRFTPASLSVGDMSTLWTAFQTNYRVSAVYEAAVVLIDSPASGPSPLPVLRRGRTDPEGVTAVASAGPRLDAVQPDLGGQEHRLSLPVRTGDRLILTGSQLGGDQVSVRFSSRHLVDPVEVAVTAPSGARLIVDLPPTVPAGFITVAVAVTRPSGDVWTSNEVGVALAPTIAIAEADRQPASQPFTLPVEVVPDLQPGQTVRLLFGGAQVAPTNVAAGTVTFDVGGQPTGTTVTARLRVDGVDSLPIPPPSPGTPLDLASFDTEQQVAVP